MPMDAGPQVWLGFAWPAAHPQDACARPAHSRYGQQATDVHVQSPSMPHHITPCLPNRVHRRLRLTDRAQPWPSHMPPQAALAPAFRSPLISANLVFSRGDGQTAGQFRTVIHKPKNPTS